LIGAHLGIVSASCTRENFRSARKHAVTALDLAEGDVHAEVEALSLLAELHVQAQRYREAQGFGVRALAKNPRAHKVPCLLRNMVYASLCLDDHETARAYFDRLCHSMSVTPNPWEHASCEYMIGYAYSRWGNHDEADEHFSRACETADRYALHEIRWRAERALRENQANAHTTLRDEDVESREYGNSWMRSELHTRLDSLADSTLRP
jgi:tetratricopeptide (TPR) repeat protein